MDYFIEEFNVINLKFKAFNDEKNEIVKENEILKEYNNELNQKNKNLLEEFESYNKVSVVKNLHNQIHEKDNIIVLLQKKIKSLKNTNNITMTTFEKEVEEQEQQVEEQEQEVEEQEVEEAQDVEEQEVEEQEQEQEVEEQEVEEQQVEEQEQEQEVEEQQVEEEEEEEQEVDEQQVEEEEQEVEEQQVEEHEVEEVEVEEQEVEEHEVEEEEEEQEEQEEEEIEFYEKKLKPPNCKDRKFKTYLITDDEYKDIYEKDENGEPSEHIGKLVGKQNKPFFFTCKSK